MSEGRYILVDGEAVPSDDLMEWARWMGEADRSVARTLVGSSSVSTVFLGLDHSFSMGGPPVLWETAVFCGGECDIVNRYTSEAKAKAGHIDTVRRLQRADEAAKARHAKAHDEARKAQNGKRVLMSDDMNLNESPGPEHCGSETCLAECGCGCTECRATVKYMAEVGGEPADPQHDLARKLDLAQAEAAKWKSAAESFGKRADSAELQIERLRRAVNSHCSCGGKGPLDPGVCDFCSMWHYVTQGEGALTRLGTSPTERPCCVEAYARGHAVGRENCVHNVAKKFMDSASLESAEKRVPAIAHGCNGPGTGCPICEQIARHGLTGE